MTLQSQAELGAVFGTVLVILIGFILFRTALDLLVRNGRWNKGALSLNHLALILGALFPILAFLAYGMISAPYMGIGNAVTAAGLATGPLWVIMLPMLLIYLSLRSLAPGQFSNGKVVVAFACALALQLVFAVGIAGEG